MSPFRPRQRSVNAYDLLPPERQKARLAADRFQPPRDVEDAEFVVISSPPRATRPPQRAQSGVRPQNDNGGRNASRATFTRRIAAAEAVSRLVMGERWLRRLSDNLFSALVALVFLLVFALAGGISAVARTGGDAGSPAPVEISHVTVTPKTLNGMPVLLVNGIIENHGGLRLASPHLRADVYSGDILVSSTLFRPVTSYIGTGESELTP